MGIRVEDLKVGINFENVSFLYNSYDKKYEALNNISIKFERKNEFIAIIGKTGSGKSTLFELSNALLKPSSGVCNILGQKVFSKSKKNLSPLRQKVGLVFQFPEYQLFCDSVISDISFGPKNFKKTRKNALTLAKKAAKDLKIEDEILNVSPFKISGGQMRKVAIAGILAMDPEILLLDEPTRGLDPITANDIMKNIHDKFLKDRKTVIIISHDLDMVYDISKRIVVLENGKVISDKKKEEYNYKDFKNLDIGIPKVLDIMEKLTKLGYIKKCNSIYSYDDLLTYLRSNLRWMI